MKKVVLALLMIVVLAFGIALALHSCRNGEIEPAPILAPTPTPEPTEPPTPTPEPTPIETPEPPVNIEPPNIDHELVGTWQYFDNWDNEPLGKYVLNADATGIVRAFGFDDIWHYIDITWEAENGILTIFRPNDDTRVFEYVIDGNFLDLTDFDGPMTFTRVE